MANRLFMKKIVDAAYHTGGFNYIGKKNASHKDFMVLSGEYAGTWTFAPMGRVSYVPHFHTAMTSTVNNHKGNMTALRTHRQNTIKKFMETLAPQFREDKVAIIAGIAGMDLQTMQDRLNEEPRRMETIKEASLPHHLRDRIKYVKALVTTWSHQKAMKATCPNIKIWHEGWYARPPEILHLFNGINFQKVTANMPPYRNWMDTHPFVKVQDVLQNENFDTLPTRRQLLNDWGYDKVKRLIDTLGTMRWLENDLGEILEGRRYLGYREAKDWKNVVKLHDELTAINNRRNEWNAAMWEVMRAEREARENTPEAIAERKALEYAEAKSKIDWHAKAKDYKLLPGITPLTTKEEFDAEGMALGHCIAGYWWQTQSHCFAFQVGEERASLELNKGKVRQFYGQYNNEAPASLKSLLLDFMKLNTAESEQI